MKDFFLPFKGVFCRVEPLVFDGTLSFLECLAKLQDYVNKLNENITTINSLIEAIETTLEGKQDTLTFDTEPTNGSTNPVTSDGIFDALTGKQDTLTFDTEPTNGSTNPVESNGIYDALAGKQNTLTFDTEPTNGSTNPVTSNGIFDALAEKQDTLTFDPEPTNGSTNPVTSNGIFDALAPKIENFVVNVTINDGILSTDKTFAEISTAYADGKRLMAIFPIVVQNMYVNVCNPLVVEVYNNIVIGFGSNFIIRSTNDVTQWQLSIEANGINIIRTPLQTPQDIENKFYDISVSSIANPVLPSGVTYAIINERAAHGCVVRMQFLDASMWLYYTDVCAFMGYDVGNDSIIVAKVSPNDNSISFV